MMLYTHIAIAMGSLIYSGFVFFAPTARRIAITYVWVALTVATGTYLVFSKPAHILQTCMSGLIYLSITLFGIALARRKLPVRIE